MNKKTELPQEPDENIWDEQPVEPAPQLKEKRIEAAKLKADVQVTNPDFDIDGLMTDFPTARDLERFVFDETGVVLNLKGRANKLKYQIAMDALNGLEIDPKYMGGENPYIDKAEMIPIDELKPEPGRDPSLPDESELQNFFVSNFIPHPDPEFRAQSKKCMVKFRKYKNGMISYEVLGNIEPRPMGEKLDKWGKTRPEIITWVDPRTGEQLIQRADGSMTPMGRNLKAIMSKMRVNNSSQWATWIDRDFVSADGGELANPWDVK
jgi:hypothetical protein